MNFIACRVAVLVRLGLDFYKSVWLISPKFLLSTFMKREKMDFTQTSRRIVRRNRLLFITLIVLLLLVAACGPIDDPEVDQTVTAIDQPTALVTAPPQNGPVEESEAYPPPQNNLHEQGEAYPPPPVPEAVIDPDGAYPPPQENLNPPDAYPGPTEVPSGTLLSFDRPITPGSTVVTGEGPSGLLIYIMNVSLMGKLEGSGVIGDDGNFSISMSPLEENVRLGITTDNAMQGLPETNVRPGEGEFNVPQVGYFYDTFVVR